MLRRSASLAISLCLLACGGRPPAQEALSSSPVDGASARARAVGPAPELVVEGGHTNNIQSLSLNREGTLLASSGSDALVKLWDVRMGRELRTFTGHSFATGAVQFSPDGRLLASGGWDRDLRLWSVDRSAADFVLSGHTGAIFDIAFTPDQRFLVSGGMKEAAVCWDLQAKVPRGVYNVKKGGSTLLSMHGSGEKVLVSGGGPDLVELSPQTCRVIRRQAWGHDVSDAVYSPDGRTIALREEDDVILLSAEDWRELRRFRAQGALLFRADGALWVGAVAYDVTSARALQTYAAAPGAVSGDGQLFASLDETGKWHAAEEGDDLFGQDRELPRSATIYSVSSGAVLGQVKSPGHIGWYGNAESPFALAHSPREPVLAVGTADGAVRLWDLRRPSGPRLLTRHDRVVHAVEFSRQGTYLASCGGGEGLVFHVGTGEQVFRHTRSCNAVAFSRDEKFVYFGGGGGEVELVDLSQKRLKKKVRVGSGAVVLLSAGDSFIAAATQESWDYVTFTPELDELDREEFATESSGGVLLNDAAVSGTRAVLGLGYHKLMVSLMESIPNSPLVVFDWKSDQVVCLIEQAHRSGVTRVALNRAGSLVATGGGDGFVKIWDADSCREIASFPGDAEVWGLEFTHDQKRLAVLGADGAVRLYEISGKRNLVATLVGLGEEDFVIALPDHHFMASRGGLRGVSFRVGSRSVPFEQYDLRLNRPDRVMKALGAADTEVILLLERAHQRRLGKMGFTEQMLAADFQLPEVELDSAPPLSTGQRNLSLRVRSRDEAHGLDRLLIAVNDVPIHGTQGIDLRGQGRASETAVSFPLNAGENRVSVSVLNERGIESLRETFSVRYTGQVKKPRLHLLTVGVSKYRDATLNLDYAAKDARDIAQFWKSTTQRYEEVRVTELLDGDATRRNFNQLRGILDKTDVDDHVVLFMAGHGMLDEKLDYYFVTHDFRRDAPSVNGLPYDAIEGLLDGIPARQKLVLIDTCHSGEVDDGAVAAALPVRSGSRSIASVGTVKIAERKLVLTKEEPQGKSAPSASSASVKNSSSLRGLLGELFADLRRGSGAVVISSAGGSEAALESSRWRNGVFTFSVLEGLDQRRADRDKNARVEVSELRDYVMQRVSDLTQGAQTPTARRENLHTDFVVY